MESGRLAPAPGLVSVLVLTQLAIKRVQIAWRSVLDDVVKSLEGTKPVYTEERPHGKMFASRVWFRIPLSKMYKECEEISLVGYDSCSLSKAEEHAVYCALHSFESTTFDTQVMDISRFICQELKLKSKIMLLKAGELNHGTRTLLDEWSHAVGEIEATYEPLYCDVVDDICNSADPMYRQVLGDVAQQLFQLKSANDKKLKAAAVHFEEVKRSVDEDYDSISRHLEDRIIPRAHDKKGDLPHKISLNMKIILDEMIKSLGWDKPELTVTRRAVLPCMPYGFNSGESQRFPYAHKENHKRQAATAEV